MDPTELADLLERRLTLKSEHIPTWTEWRTQLEVTDALLDAGHKAFMEYTYPGTGGACDIVVTRSDNCEDVLDWIELKPILPGYFYWNPSKFIVEARFKHDIRKLAALPRGDRWFLMVMVTDTPLPKQDQIPNPRKRVKLNPAQVAAVVSYWARSRPVAVRSFAAGDAWCHMFLWNVCACCEDDIEVRQGEYIVGATVSGGAG